MLGHGETGLLPGDLEGPHNLRDQIMVKSNSNTNPPEWALAELKISRHISHDVLTGTREEILSTGIIPAELLPRKIQNFEIVHNGRRIKEGKYGYGKWARWELFVHDRHSQAARPALTLVQCGE